MQQFGNLQAIIDRADEIAKPSICESVKRNTERLGMNYSLIKLGNTVEMPFTIDELKYVYSGVTTNEILERIGVK